ncbi:LRP5 [Branchiostoma lanceolatum]|uniref:LRP5 protein n=1 Tax=Branchiostoma lanceolatum TaxID=7740 RepID=A0A8J9Z631_BRALA|nr:LRP5 [Branchiostoma lanceolatum]
MCDRFSRYVGWPFALDYDPFTDYVYWSDGRDDDIKRAHRDGSGKETIIDTGSSVAEGLALDHAGWNIYWSVRDAHAIYVANKDGSSARTLLTSPAIELPEGIVLDPIYG